MSLLKIIIMGVIQGLTEFLPVSSSGHLAIFSLVFGMDTDTGLFFDVLLHVGTLAAIFVAFWEDILALIKEGFGLLFDLCFNIGAFFGRKKYRELLATDYRRFVLLVILASIPTAIIGILGKDMVERAGQSLLVPGICLIVTALLLFAASFSKGGSITERDCSFGKGLFIGLVQGIATLPGLSRSGSTVSAGLMCGFDKEFAVRYSFIMSVPAVLGAALLDLKDVAEDPSLLEGFPLYLIGMLVAGIVGYFSIKGMLAVVRNKKYHFFGIYCMLAGIAALACHFIMGK